MAKKKILSWKVNPLPSAGQYVNSVAISEDASTLVAGTYFYDYTRSGHTPSGHATFTVGVFAYNKDKSLKWKDEFDVTEGVYWVAVSRDSKWAAAGGLEMHGQGFISAYKGSSGTKKLNFKTPARTNMVALNSSGSVLVAGADILYIFSRSGATWNAVPQQISSPQANDTVISVAISSDGKSVVAGTLKGSVLFIDNSGAAPVIKASWQLPGRSVHWISMAANGSAFAVGGSGSDVYYFTLPSFGATGTPAWTGALTGCNSCRSVAVSDDGAFVSAVANKGKAGKLFFFAADGTLKWSKPTINSPNSTSMDGTGSLVTVADGFPDGSPGSFNLFDTNGNSLWSYPTNNMSWPMQISANGKGIAAGSDNSNVYYFL